MKHRKGINKRVLGLYKTFKIKRKYSQWSTWWPATNFGRNEKGSKMLNGLSGVQTDRQTYTQGNIQSDRRSDKPMELELQLVKVSCEFETRKKQILATNFETHLGKVLQIYLSAFRINFLGQGLRSRKWDAITHLEVYD